MRMALLLAWSICLCGSVAFGRDYYVATDGDDANPGTIEKPFATLEKARDAIRQQRSEGATVILRGGKYFRTESFTLTEQARAKGNNGQWGGWLPAWSWDRFWNHIHMFGGKVVDEKYGKKCMLGEPEAQEALKWMYDLEWTDNCHAQPSQVENKWPDQSMVSLMVCSAEDGTYPINVDVTYEGAVDNWDIRHVPKGPTGKILRREVHAPAEG